jgi:hypothetical protein
MSSPPSAVGRRLSGRWPQIATGRVLIAYPYFIPGVRLMLDVAGVLRVVFWILLRLGW